VAESKVSASAVKWRGATLTCPGEKQKVLSVLKHSRCKIIKNTTETNICFRDNVPAIARPH